MSDEPEYIEVNLGLNIVATFHMTDANDIGQPWTCTCCACEDMRANPKLAETFWKAVQNEKQRRDLESN